MLHTIFGKIYLQQTQTGNTLQIPIDCSVELSYPILPFPILGQQDKRNFAPFGWIGSSKVQPDGSYHIILQEAINAETKLIFSIYKGKEMVSQFLLPAQQNGNDLYINFKEFDLNLKDD